MNIFALDKDPILAAQYNNSRHTVKMLTELAQLLSTAHRVLDGTESVGLTKSGRRQKQYEHPDSRVQELLYKATHINHPSAKYCRHSSFAYSWATRHLLGLSMEYTYRYGRQHKCSEIGLVHFLLNNVPKNIPINNDFLLPFPAMPEEYIFDDAVESYRTYYRSEKRHLANWSGTLNSRSIPEWWY